VRALDTIRFAIQTHRGCYGECNFCAIAVHQGRTVVERSEESILREAEKLARHKDFKGIIQDVGGPTANMYGIECERKKRRGACRERRCLTPDICRHMPVSHKKQIRLLRKLRKIPNVKKVFIGSGIRYDLILQDKEFGHQYLDEIIKHHISGQLKIAPEHSETQILRLMGKPGRDLLKQFVLLFRQANAATGKKQFLTCYFIAAYPGCTIRDMQALKEHVHDILKFTPEQVQIFTPSPSTFATLMYYTELDCIDGKSVFVEKDIKQKIRQKDILITPCI
ncbi:MAG: radical SAM protein, partial [Pseudomonadota bacterium]